MDQQRSAILKHEMLQLSAYVLNLCLQPKSSLINHLTNDRLLDA